MEHPDKCQFISADTRAAYTVAYRLMRYDALEKENAELLADSNRYRHALGQIGFRCAGTELDAISDRVLAVLHKGEPVNPLYDPKQTY